MQCTNRHKAQKMTQGKGLQIIRLPWFPGIALSVILTLISSLVTAQVIFEKFIDIKLTDVPVSDALLELSNVADVSIVFNSRYFEPGQKVTINAENESVHSILKEILKNTNVGFKTDANTIVLYKKPPRKYTVSGYVRDVKSWEGLVLASVWVKNSSKGTTSNDYGFYSLELPEGETELMFSYLGYQPILKKFLLKKNTTVNAELLPSLQLNEVIVTSDNLSHLHQGLLGKGIGISLEEMQNAPSLGGEVDLFRYLQLQSGVQSGADGFSGIHIRGGNADQNLVLLDGVPVYNPAHTLGLFSIFNTHIIKSARLIKGGFSAKYGGRLSSVIDVRTKEGNTRQTGFTGEFGTLATKLILEGPLKKEKAGFIVSLRRTHLDPIVQYISKKQKEKNFETGLTNYFFYDINAKIHTKMSNDNRLFLSFYTGADKYSNSTGFDGFFEDTLFVYDNAQKLYWGNIISSLRWNKLYNDKLFSNTTLTYSKYNYVSRNGILYSEIIPGDTLVDNYFTSFQSSIKDAGIKTDFEYNCTEGHRLYFGVGALIRQFEPGSFGADDAQLNDVGGIGRIDSFEDFDEGVSAIYFPKKFNAQEINFYLEDKVKISESVTLLAGLHAASFLTNEKDYLSLQPRVSIQYGGAKIFRARISLSRMTQFLHVLTTSGNGFPNDLWVPSTLFVEPEHAWQTTAAVFTDLKNGINAGLEIYYKKMKNLISYREGVGLPGLVDNNPTFWEEEITVGEGSSQGFEFQIRKEKGRTRGLCGYSLSFANRQFPGINRGKDYPFRYLHRHSFKIYVSHSFSKNLSLSASWQYGSGQRVTLVKSDAPFAPLDNLLGNVADPLVPTNGTLLPEYHRLDISLDFFWSKRAAKHSISIGAYNVYNRSNPYFIYILEDEFFPEDNGLKKQRSLPVFPSLRYGVSL